jgi:hypothetical protein
MTGASEQRQRAIARVEVQGGGATTSRGTGFLVHADGLLLTAAHVVFNVNGPGKPRFPGEIQLFFATRSASPPPLVRGVTVVAQDLDEDWALLRCTPPVGTEPIPLQEMPPTIGAAWATFGYPDGGDRIRGDGYSGVIGNRYETHLDLDSSGSGSNAVPPGDKAKGLSGAPCLVDDAAVGLVVARPNDGKVVAIRSHRILNKQPGLRSVRLPFELSFGARLANVPGPELKELAAALKLSDEDLVSPGLHEKIARAMLAFAPGELAEIIRATALGAKGLKAEAGWLLQLIETLWVKNSAASEFARFVEAEETRAAVINTEEARAGHHYVARASDLKASLNKWRVCRFQPDVQHATPDALLAAAREELWNKLMPLGTPKSEDQLKRMIRLKKPVILLVLDPAARTEIVALEEAFPGLRVALLTGASLPLQSATRTDLMCISPAIEPLDQESYLDTCFLCDGARADLGIQASEYAP